MSYVIFNGKYVTYNGAFATYTPASIIPPVLNFKLSMIRNQEMNNIVGDAGSTNLTISNISDNTLTIPNLPSYGGFYQDISSWVVVPTNGSNLESPVFCASINDVNHTVIVKDNVARFSIGQNVALYNPFLNYKFVGNQISTPSIAPSDLVGWGNTYCGSGSLMKVGSTYKWLFYALTTSYNQIGLATSSDLQTWNIENNGGPWVQITDLPNCSSIFPSGNIGQIDSSYYCLVQANNATTSLAEIKIMYFDQDVSNRTYSAALKTNAGAGSVTKIGSEYHILYIDVSTSMPYRNLRAAKSSNLDGPYTDYQVSIMFAASAPAGTSWTTAVSAPTIYNIDGSVFGLVGVEGANYAWGGGVNNRQHALLDYDSNTQTWTLNPKGPVMLNPIDWGNTGSSDYSWAVDHDGAGQTLFIDGSSAYFGNTFGSGSNTYRASMTKLNI